MKNNNYSVYATNKGGKIAAPKKQSAGEARATAIKGDDLRQRRASKPTK